MKRIPLLLWCCVVCLMPAISTRAGEAVKIIFDTDIGNDVDDVMALAELHALETRGKCELLGVTITKPDELAGPFVSLMDTFYGRPEIPIGFTHSKLPNIPSKFLGLAEIEDSGRLRYPHALARSSDAPAATRLLRQLLSRQPDHSVVMIQVGYFSNLASLLDTPADDLSPLTGKELIRQKVKFACVMAGSFKPIDGNGRFHEFNVMQDLPAAKKVAAEWPTPMIWSGYEIGIAIPFPAISIQRDFSYVRHHPVPESYCLYQPPPHERPTWDLTAALYAVFPGRNYFGLSEPGRVTVETDGYTSFAPSPDGRDRYLTLDPVRAVRVREAFVELVTEPPNRGDKEALK